MHLMQLYGICSVLQESESDPLGCSNSSDPFGLSKSTGSMGRALDELVSKIIDDDLSQSFAEPNLQAASAAEMTQHFTGFVHTVCCFLVLPVPVGIFKMFFQGIAFIKKFMFRADVNFSVWFAVYTDSP